MRRDTKSAQEYKLQKLRSDLVREIEHWKTLCDYGCNDPFWTDGVNMELTRNHIVYYKAEIIKLCEENELTLPEEAMIPTPPKVSRNYMASLKPTDDHQKSRLKRLREDGCNFVTRKPVISGQMSFL